MKRWCTAAAAPRRIQNGDIVSLDVGAIVDGWHGDNAMTVPVGMVDPEKAAAAGRDGGIPVPRH